MLKALKAGWIEKNADAFLTSLEAYAYPKLAKLRVDGLIRRISSMCLRIVWNALS